MANELTRHVLWYLKNSFYLWENVCVWSKKWEKDVCAANILRERKLMSGAIYISVQKDVFAREKKEMNEEVYSSNSLSKKVKNTPLRYISRL